MFKRCALAQIVPWLVMIPLSILLALIGPRLIRHWEAKPVRGAAAIKPERQRGETRSDHKRWNNDASVDGFTN